MAVQDRLYTAHDLAAMPEDGKVYELHNGVLIEVAGSKYRQTRLAIWIAYLLMTFIEQHKLGGAVTGADGAVELNQYNTRIPDVAYITAERAQAQSDDSYIQGAPDLAVEVVSVSNSDVEMQQRAGEYLSAGARLVWIVNPAQRTVDIYRPGGARQVLENDGILDGGDVLPSLVLPVQRVFEQLKTNP
ncbi:MAG TPA: Uma2 family endonuclease [Aggregatilineales bacterium]|nr:Uma2 family endonuclease [Aggregatilineales bacterium]